jgi:HK97 gp10 family phage protein
MQVKGINEVISNLRKYGKEAEKDVEGVTELTARNIEKYAKQSAPVNFGKLGQSIVTEKVNPTTYKVVVNAPYGAYMEFGTGTKVEVPSELESVAREFQGKKSGNFKTALEDIKQWCRSKGIPEEAAYPILAKILKVGITPKPYLYPAYLRGKTEYLDKLKKVLNKYGKTKSK